jgi:hypothetical protein
VVPRWTGPLYLALGVGTLGWVGVLFADYLSTPRRCPDPKVRCGAFLTTSLRQYTLAWVVFDLALAAMLLVTGWMAVRRQEDRLAVPAAVTGALLVVDAWFDTMTSPRGGQPLAWAEAVFVELPLGALCLWLALRAERGRRSSP